MLGKCLKHEWIETWMVGLLCCAGVMLISILAFFLLPLIPKLSESEVGIYVLPVLILTLVIMGVAAFGGALFIGRYFFFYRYYKNLFTDQGYLMHTLPVETSDLINSKLIVALIWQYLIAVSYFVAILFTSAGFYGMFSDDYTSYVEFIKSVIEGIGLLYSVGKLEIILFAACAIIYPIMDMMLLFLAVAFGQLGKKNRFILSIVALIGISFVKKFVTNIVSLISAIFSYSDYNTESALDMVQTHYGIMLALILVLETAAIIGAYVLNLHMVKNKLNLE